MKAMKYVTTNIRLPEPIWKALKIEAAHEGRRFAEVVRERLAVSLRMQRHARKPRSLYGLWKGVRIPDEAVEEAKHSIFTSKEYVTQ